MHRVYCCNECEWSPDTNTFRMHTQNLHNKRNAMNECIEKKGTQIFKSYNDRMW